VSTEAEALAKLRREIAARGWNRKATVRVTGELLLNLAAAAGGIWVFVHYCSLLVRVCAMIVSTAGSMGAATNTHTSSHYATSRRRWVNELLTYVGYPFLMGVSACHWWHKHIVLHHPAPNVIGVDSDVNLGPWFARTDEEVRRASGWRRFYYERLQWLVFPLAIPFILFSMQVEGWHVMIRGLRRPAGRKTKLWIDLAAVTSHYVLWIVIPLAYFTPAHVVGFYLLRMGLMGCTMFAVLAPGHFPSEAACLRDTDANRSDLLLQTAATVNFRTGWIGRMVCSGLEYQIEHHLFPSISHVYYPKLAPLVEQFCQVQGLPYRTYSWDVAIVKCLRMFRSPSPVHADLASLRSMSASFAAAMAEEHSPYGQKTETGCDQSKMISPPVRTGSAEAAGRRETRTTPKPAPGEAFTSTP
jgi:linoleoyl-CoA desaturase